MGRRNMIRAFLLLLSRSLFVELPCNALRHAYGQYVRLLSYDGINAASKVKEPCFSQRFRIVLLTAIAVRAVIRCFHYFEVLLPKSRITRYARAPLFI